MLASWATLESFTAFIYIFIKTRGSVFSMELVGKWSFGVLTTMVPCNLKSQFCTERAALLLTVNSEWWIARQREECSRSPGSFPNAAWVMYSFASLAGPRSELSLQFSSVPVRKPKEIEKRHLRVGAAGGGLGRKPESSELMWVKVRARAPRGTVNIVWDWDSCDQCPWGVTWQIPSVTAQTDYNYKPEERFLCALALLNIKEHRENSSCKQKCRDSGISSGKKKEQS